MSLKRRSSNLLTWGLLGSLVFLCSCTNQMAALRKVTYPPDFNYIDTSTLRTEMGQLAQQMHYLDEMLLERPNHDEIELESQRQEVLDALAQIKRIASRLKAGEAGANHPFMQDHMQRFISQVGEARVAASLPEPRYYYATKISSACANCHRINR